MRIVGPESRPLILMYKEGDGIGEDGESVLHRPAVRWFSFYLFF